MEIKTKGKYVKISPQKVTPVLVLIRKKNALEALDILKFVNKKAARITSKILKTAIYDAEHNFHLKKEKLIVSQAIVGSAGAYKRYQPQAKGIAAPILKRMSHITIVVSGEEKIAVPKPEPKTTTQVVAPEKEKEMVSKKEIKEEKKEIQPVAEQLETKKEETKEEVPKISKAIPREVKEQPKFKEEKRPFWHRFFRRKSV